MHLGIEGKSSLVVGGSQGLGREIALTLAKEGVQVGVVARTEADIISLVAEMGGEAKGHWGIAKDLVPDRAPTQLIEEIQSGNKQIDIIIHNLGGTLAIRDPFCTVTEWRSVWRLNFEIAAELNRYLIPPMQQRRWGRVVHISSIAANLSRGAVAYCAVKAALNAYTRNLGCTVASDGVVITSVMPGAIRHEGSHWDKMSQEKPEMVATYLDRRMAIKRFAQLDEISDWVVLLCSEKASFCTGSVMPIDGGSW
ncbi:MAG: SDR family NAD(P)-dependent oxidoreductase [Microcoleus anatoxicus]|uniref:SDR family NAD(P)-dependent oxidoreductase n=1 Tax=Microcoleus anatoxicus TaxID=2705319 RepID=UPI0036716380